MEEGSLLLPSVESPDEPDLGSSATVPHLFLFHPQTGTGNRNPDDVTIHVGRGQHAYNIINAIYLYNKRKQSLDILVKLLLIRPNIP